MQAVQLDQLIPQLQTIQTTPQDLKTGDSSFMDALRASQTEYDSMKKSEAVAKNSDQNTEKTDASANSSEEENSIQQNYETMAVYIQRTDDVPAVEYEAIEISDDLQVSISDEITPETLTEKQIQWLRQPVAKSAVEEDFSSEEFAKLIEAAAEFIPGEATEEELLEQSQNLVVSDPEMFLEKNAVVAENADFNIKNPLDKTIPDSKEKTAPVKVEKKNVTLEVKDLRTAKIDEQSNEIAVTKAQSKKEFNLSYKRENQTTVQVTMDLSQTVKQDITASSSQAAGANGSTFQNMLTQAVQQNAPDFVKAGSIVLKDNKQGNINLILHPEKLGNVKISLDLNDKVISGSITVHSKEAYDAMKESIASLKNAFANSGFETGEFNLNFTDNSQQYAQQQGNNQQNQQANILANRYYGEFNSNNGVLDVNPEAAYAQVTDYSVNIVA